MIQKYVKRSCAVEAVQWTGENFDELVDFVGLDVWVDDGQLFMKYLDGVSVFKGKIGDYIVKGIHGVCIYNKKIFEEAYTKS